MAEARVAEARVAEARVAEARRGWRGRRWGAARTAAELHLEGGDGGRADAALPRRASPLDKARGHAANRRVRVRGGSLRSLWRARLLLLSQPLLQTRAASSLLEAQLHLPLRLGLRLRELRGQPTSLGPQATRGVQQREDADAGEA